MEGTGIGPSRKAIDDYFVQYGLNKREVISSRRYALLHKYSMELFLVWFCFSRFVLPGYIGSNKGESVMGAPSEAGANKLEDPT